MSEAGEGTLFNTNLPIDATSRVSPSIIAVDAQSEHPNIPWYVADAVELRRELMPARYDVELITKPEAEFTSAEQFFGKVSERSEQIWAKYGQETFGKRVNSWIGQIREADIENKDTIIGVLSNPSELNTLFQIRQFGVLEDIKEKLPDLWCSMLLVSAERQYSQIALARRWVKDISNDELTNFFLSKS